MYVSLGLYMRPMGPACPLGLFYGPWGSSAPPPLKSACPPLCMRALGLFYALWDSFMAPRAQVRAPL
jgi:hypothetical protein